MSKRRVILILVGLIVTLSIISVYLILFETNRPAPGLNVRPVVGTIAPDFELLALGGDHVKLSSYRGNIVFLNVWATWCPPCREEMPSMELLDQRLKGRNFKMLAVSIDRDGEKVVPPFIEKHGLGFPVLLDPNSETYRLYGLTGVPETFIIDKNGIILQKIIGPQDWTKKDWLDYFDGAIG